MADPAAPESDRDPIAIPEPGVDPPIVHGTAVAVDGRAALILGASGKGKSALALSLMAYGAQLVADDRVVLSPGRAGPMLSAPASIAGLIEARCFGLLPARHAPSARLVLALDLDRSESARLPPSRHWLVFGHPIPLFHNPASGQVGPAILQYLKGGGDRA